MLTWKEIKYKLIAEEKFKEIIKVLNVVVSFQNSMLEYLLCSETFKGWKNKRDTFQDNNWTQVYCIVAP